MAAAFPSARPPSRRVLLASALRYLAAGFTAAIGFNAAVMLIVFALSLAARAEVLIENPSLESVRGGELLLRRGEGLGRAPLLQTDVSIRVSGLVARASVRQRFVNPDDEWQEGIYVFPLPASAAVDRLRMFIGERVIEGQVQERQAARRMYRQARAAGKRASLVEQERPNIFTNSVANIGPGETIIVEIEYQQRVDYADEWFSLRFPMVVGPRYIPGQRRVDGFAGHGWAFNTDAVPDAARITPPVATPGGGARNPVTLEVRLDAGLPVAEVDSAYHAVVVDRHDQRHLRVRLRDAAVPADRDFELSWRLEPRQLPQAALFTETYGDYRHALIMLVPPTRGRELPLAREVVFVIDTSGSMGGASIRQARDALLLGLERLRTGDRFNLIQFNSNTHQLFESPRPVTPESLGQAKAYVHGLDARGGTEMAGALQAALANQAGDRLVRQVIFLTDGAVGNEAALFRIIDTQLGKTRLFTIGIGSAPNSHFMRGAARHGRGSFTYIGEPREIAEKMSLLFRKLETPVVSDVALDAAGSDDAELWPARIPDLYAGEPLIISLRAKRLPPALAVSGMISGQIWRREIVLDGGAEQAGVAVLWARRKIEALEDARITDTGSNAAPSVKDEIVATALAYHLVSAHTSLVAVDVTPARVRDAILKSRALATNLPHGWDYERVFGALPATATPAPAHLLAGALLLAAWAAAWRRAGRRRSRSC